MDIEAELSELNRQKEAGEILPDTYQLQRQRLLDEWRNTLPPKKSRPVEPPKNRNIYILIAFFLGFMGIHNFYVERYVRAITQLVFSVLFIFIPINIFWVLIDMLTVVTDGSHRTLIPLNGWGTILILIYTLFLALLIFGVVFAVKMAIEFFELALTQPIL